MKPKDHAAKRAREIEDQEATMAATNIDAPSRQEDVEMPQNAASAPPPSSSFSAAAAAAKVGTGEISPSTAGFFFIIVFFFTKRLFTKGAPSEIDTIY